jgi:hypothetical protein
MYFLPYWHQKYSHIEAGIVHICHIIKLKQHEKIYIFRKWNYSSFSFNYKYYFNILNINLYYKQIIFSLS